MKNAQNSLTRSKASGTVKTYNRWTKVFKEFCSLHKLCDLPALSSTVTIFIQSLIEKKYSSSALLQAVAAIGWYHQLGGLADPSRNSMVSNLVSAHRRNAGAGTQRTWDSRPPESSPSILRKR